MSGYLRRMRGAIDLEKQEVIPAFLWNQDFVAHEANTKYKAYVTDGSIMAKCQYEHIRKYDMDYAIIHGDDWMEVEEMGVRTILPDNEAPAPVYHPIRPSQPMRNITIPDYKKGGRLQVRIEAIRALRDTFNNDVMIIGHVNAPFTMASYLLGIQDALLLPYDNPDFLVEIMEIGLKNGIECARAQVEAGAHMVWVGDDMASSWTISLEHFRRFALPYQKRIIESIHRYGAYTFIQMHEDELPRLEILLETTSDVINVGRGADLRKVAKVLKGKRCFLGNMDPETVLLKGSISKIKEEIDECISVAAPGGGYIIGSCHNIPRYTPRENYRFFFDYVGSYPNR